MAHRLIVSTCKKRASDLANNKLNSYLSPLLLAYNDNQKIYVRVIYRLFVATFLKNFNPSKVTQTSFIGSSHVNYNPLIVVVSGRVELEEEKSGQKKWY